MLTYQGEGRGDDDDDDDEDNIDIIYEIYENSKTGIMTLIRMTMIKKNLEDKKKWFQGLFIFFMIVIEYHNDSGRDDNICHNDDDDSTVTWHTDDDDDHSFLRWHSKMMIKETVLQITFFTMIVMREDIMMILIRVMMMSLDR